MIPRKEKANELHKASNLRVLYVTGRLFFYQIGGPAEVGRNLAFALSKYPNVKLTVLGTSPPKIPIPSTNNLRILALATSKHADSITDIILSWFGYPILRGIKKYDIIHFDIFPGLRASSIFIISRLIDRRCPILITVNGLPSQEFLYEASGLVTIFRRIHWTISKKLMRLSRVLIVNSEYEKTEIKKQGISNQNMVVIPNGVGNEFFDQNSHDVLQKKIIVNYGAFHPIKGQDLLIKAFKIADCKKDHKLILIGGPDGKFKSSCKGLVSRLGLNGKVYFFNFMSHKDLIPLLKESEFCVFPSRLETFNIAALESMALGKAVIATKRGGPSDYIKNGWDGILVDPEDIDGLASAMDFLASNPTVRVEIGKHAQARAQDFKWDQVAKNYLSLYKACLAVAKTASSTTVCKNYSSFRIN